MSLNSRKQKLACHLMKGDWESLRSFSWYSFVPFFVSKTHFSNLHYLKQILQRALCSTNRLLPRCLTVSRVADQVILCLYHIEKARRHSNASNRGSYGFWRWKIESFHLLLLIEQYCLPLGDIWRSTHIDYIQNQWEGSNNFSKKVAFNIGERNSFSFRNHFFLLPWYFPTSSCLYS
jgi:hypothetical protein